MIRIGAVLKVLGVLLIVLGSLMLSSLPFSFYYGGEDAVALFSSALVTSFTGLGLWYFNKSQQKIGKREGYLIVALGWLSMGIVSMLPYLFSGVLSDFTNAFFESISGLTTTGASVINDIEAVPKGVLFWRSLTQWIGGMGIIVLTVALLPLFGVGGVELFMAEAPGPSSGKLHPKITDTAKRLWIIYVLLTLAETIMLKVAGMTWLDALNHAFTTMSTGGFSTKNASIAAYNSPAIEYIITAFMLVGGINFSILYFIVKGIWKKVLIDEEFKTYLGIIVVFTVAITSTLVVDSDKGLEESFRHAVFQVVTIITTTGFSTANYALWAPFAYMLILFLMFTGGSASSTSGGVKVLRHLIILKNGYMEFKRLLHPRGIIPVRINNKSVEQRTVYNVLAFFFIYLFVFILGALVISAFGHDLMTSAGASIACLGNIGPGIGDVDPSHNFAGFSTGAKFVLSFLMLLGRLELFTVLIIFTPSFWSKV